MAVANSGRFVVIPSFNEATRLPRILGKLKEVDMGAEICVVDDGSLDKTSEVAIEHGATVLRHPFNLGYGAALQTGYKYAYQNGAELVLQMDADGQHKPSLFPELMRPIIDGEADLVVGSRFLEPTRYQDEWLAHGGPTLVSSALRASVDCQRPTRRRASRRSTARFSSFIVATSSRAIIPTSTSCWSRIGAG